MRSCIGTGMLWRVRRDARCGYSAGSEVRTNADSVGALLHLFPAVGEHVSGRADDVPNGPVALVALEASTTGSTAAQLGADFTEEATEAFRDRGHGKPYLSPGRSSAAEHTAVSPAVRRRSGLGVRLRSERLSAHRRSA